MHGMHVLSAIANDIVVAYIKAIKALILVLVALALSARGREETVFTLPPTSSTRGVVWAINASKIALHLAATTRNACLIDSLMSWLSWRRIAGWLVRLST